MTRAFRHPAVLLGLAGLTVGLTGLLFQLRSLSPPSADSTEIATFWVESDYWIWYVRWPLTMLLAQALHHGLGLSGADSLAVLSSVAGALFLITVGAVSRRSPLILLVLLSSATLTLIGHVEVYAWPMLTLLWLLLMGPLHLRGRIPFTPVLTVFAVGCLFHMLVVFYTPALVWLAAAGRRRALERGTPHRTLNADLTLSLLGLVIFLTLVATGPLVLSPAGLDNDLGRLVPLNMPAGVRSSNQVTLFSPGHLTQIGIFLTISCPVGLALVAVRAHRAWATDTLRFSSLAALCGLIFLLLWHPDMGWLGDWDLFSHPGLVINVLAWRLWGGSLGSGHYSGENHA